MATYVYESTDPAKPVKRFELQQSMNDTPLTRHPETGEPIQRVITGGYGYMAKGNPPKESDMRSNSSGGCGPSCACC